MYLRKLEICDLPHMKSWMKDNNVASFYRKSFAKMTDEEIKHFIQKSQNDSSNMHLAIVSDDNEYMGTVSLKRIIKGTAELAIVVRSEAMGRGYSWFGMEEILKIAFEELNLNCVYWCVSRDNERAIRFYDKHNFHESLDIPKHILARYENVSNLKWYSVLAGDRYNERNSVAGCRVLHVKTVSTLDSGELSFFESTHDIPFEIKRVYYISKVPEGMRRGFHAHKSLKQLLFCPYGRIQLILENQIGREEIELSDPSVAVLIDRPTWREMLWLQKDSVLCVAASDYYDEDDYIRNYDEFRRTCDLQ